MNRLILKPLTLLTLAAAAFAAWPGAALAIDGQTLINHSNATSGYVTAGDTPGYPVTISQPGSYKLSGNLVLPDGHTTAIEITADNVTLDLNGFAILGPAKCNGSWPCANAGAGFGIRTPAVQFNITVRNGTIQGMGSVAIELHGDSHLVEHLRVRSNGGGGISIVTDYNSGASSRVQHSAVQRNGNTGIFVMRGVAEHNTADANQSAGIWVNDGRVAYNTVSRNGAYGIGLYTAGAIGNVMRDHSWMNLYGGTNLGHNLCSGSGGGC
jgi:Right handed beta helix region